MNECNFKRMAFALAQRFGGRVVGIREPDVTPNFIAAEFDFGGEVENVFLIQSHEGEMAFARSVKYFAVEFVDLPEMSEYLTEVFGINPKSVSELNSPFVMTAEFSASDVKYWNPRTVGEAVFNWWD